jgi:kynurenine formamidase/mono/diheme cytochrome c family protein
MPEEFSRGSFVRLTFKTGALLSLLLVGAYQVVGVAAGPLAAAPKDQPKPANAAITEVYRDKCAACHGTGGQGAITLPRLPDFTDTHFQNSRTDKQMIAAISNGGDAMPAFKQELEPDQIRLLVRYVRSFGPGSLNASREAPRDESVSTSPSQGGAAHEGLLERALSGHAHIYDLTHVISSKTPAYDGSQDSYQYKKLADIDKDGYTLGVVTIPEHFGTHIDAPAHFIRGKQTVDQLDPGKLIAAAIVIDVRDKVRENPDYRLTPEAIQSWEHINGPIPAGAVIMLLTGWGDRYGDPEKYRNPDSSGVMHFPGYSAAGIDYLLKHARPVGLGIDTLSIDYGPSKDFEGHRLALSSGLYHIENVANLDRLPAKGAVVFVGPLPFEGGSGSPGRVLAIAP